MVLDAHELRGGAALGFHLRPLVGVFAGWLVFGEKVTAAFALAIALVLAGLALVNWPRRRASKS
jgi:drug/metabolite transporter (DMT)-like permease